MMDSLNICSRVWIALAFACFTCSMHVLGQDEVISVGGFVSTSQQLAAALKANGLVLPDLSAVRIELFNPAGVKQSEGDCSPNGYYFVPVDPGSYTVRVHALPGWVFTPSQVQISCDQQQCNGGADVNFELSGLQLSGHVEAGPSAASCRAAAPAPFSGITVTIRAADSKETVATATVEDSSFTTGPLLPGKYVVTAAHPDWQLGPARITHTLALDAPQLPRPFQVSGYLLTGSVTSRSGPVSGIQVTLFSTDITSAGCSSSHPAAASDADGAGAALCSVTSGPTGQFALPGVPCGSYSLQAQHPLPESTFEITPASMVVVVGQGNAKASEPFTVTGFSVQGRVVDGAGNGVAGAVISVAGEERATTDGMGRYVLGRMQEGRVDISAAKQHYTFSSLSAVQVTPAAQVVPDIQVKKVAVCGRLVYGSDSKFKAGSRRISMTSTDDAAVAEQVAADASGGFCFSVPAGRYRVAPYVSGDEKSRGLLFSPGHADLRVEGQPLLDLAFNQAQLTVSGSVVCLDRQCLTDVQLQLKTAAGKVAFAATLGEVASKDGTGGTATPFQLPRISPGRYSLVASRKGWCWEAPEGVDVTVDTSDVEAPALVQAGYLLQFSCSHVAELSVTSPSGTLVATLSAAPGQGSVCLPGSGDYTVNPSSCYIFSDESFTVNVAPAATPEPLTLQAVKVYVSGQIVVQAGEEPLPEDITVTAALAHADDSAAGVITKATPEDEQQPNVFSYTLAVDLGSTVTITPSVAGDSTLLFYPANRAFKHDAAAKACPPAVQTIQAKPGVMVSGVVEPPVEGAVVKVLFKTQSIAAGGVPGDLAAEGVTDAEGAFSLGPLYDDASYDVELSKPGHIFSEEKEESDGRLLFKSKQLAQVRVTVELPEGAEPSGVFLSLSGGQGFKNNARLAADRTLTFLDLQPGTYYLKPLLREHRFDPPVADLSLEDGQTVDVTLTAIRSAWGISGVVTSVGGAPLSGAVIEACQGSGAAMVVLDSSVTDDSGSYRVGNLKPGHTYDMRVQLDGRVTSAHPAGKKVELGQGDVTGVNFIAFRTSSSRSALSGVVNVPRPFRLVVKAELVPAGAASKSGGPGVAVSVDASGFFEMRGLKPGSYLLRLSCDTATAAGLSCDPWDRTVQVTSKDVHLGVLPFQPSTAATTSTIATGGATALSDEGLDWKAPVLVLVLLVAASATILQPTIIDILQLRPPATSTTDAATSFDATAPRQTASRRATADGGSTGGSRAVATPVARPAAAAPPPPPVPAVTAVAAAVDLPSSSEDEFEDVEVKPAGSRSKAAGAIRSRARRA